MVKHMVHEGLLTSSHAEEFLESIGKDTERIEKERVQMYRDHEDTFAFRRSESVKTKRREKDTHTITRAVSHDSNEQPDSPMSWKASPMSPLI